MPATTNYNYPYPSSADDPDVPADIQALAEALDDETVRIDGDLAALALVTALFATGAAVADSKTAIGQTTSASYTETFTGSNTPCAVAFTAPPSGKVMVHNSSYIDNNGTAGRTYFSWILREGAVIGSGTVVAAANDGWSLEVLGVNDVTCGRATLITGLTPGASYNIRQAMKQTGGTVAESQNRHLAVEPVWK